MGGASYIVQLLSIFGVTVGLEICDVSGCDVFLLQTCEIVMERNVSSDVQITDDTRLRERVSNTNYMSEWIREFIYDAY